jgi:hypothetical protein
VKIINKRLIAAMKLCTEVFKLRIDMTKIGGNFDMLIGNSAIMQLGILYL